MKKARFLSLIFISFQVLNYLLKVNDSIDHVLDSYRKSDSRAAKNSQPIQALPSPPISYPPPDPTIFFGQSTQATYSLPYPPPPVSSVSNPFHAPPSVSTPISNNPFLIQPLPSSNPFLSAATDNQVRRASAPEMRQGNNPFLSPPQSPNPFAPPTNQNPDPIPAHPNLSRNPFV